MSEIIPNGYAGLHLETELSQGEHGRVVTVLHSETQPLKHGSYMNGQLAADGREQNTAKAVHWRNSQAFVDKLKSLHDVTCSFYIMLSTGDLVLIV